MIFQIRFILLIVFEIFLLIASHMVIERYIGEKGHAMIVFAIFAYFCVYMGELFLREMMDGNNFD